MESIAGIPCGRARLRVPFFAAAAAAAVLAAGCARREAPPPPAQAAAPGAGAESTATASATVTAATATTAPPPTTRTPPPPSAKRAQGQMDGPAASGAPAVPPAEAPPAASSPKVDDPGGPVAVPSRNSAARRVGPEKCRVCHKIQFASWAETGHAKRNPPLDCESCHGPGSEYKSLATMKDPEKAKAAGLVLPDAKFCATCHKRDWTSDMLEKAHAHKAKPAE